MSLLINHLKISINGKSLFPEVHMEITKGNIQTLMGPSGCGKSTILAAISGTLSTNFSIAGEIFLDDLPLMNLPTEERQVGILFQDDLLFPHFNVCQNLMFALPQNISKKVKLSRIFQALESAGLQGFDKRDIATLSGGQRARISMLRALLAEPKAILLDEPFSKLDAELKLSFREFVFNKIKEMNIPALLVSHDRADCYGDQYFDLQTGQFKQC